ncbi:MAG: RdgB/HAM1 family non-canonical purine NTP pyrophosphatase [Nocardioidaceae bacterium]|nr:RdgB/HAM1 family non-canonical purine NTP pyrophosphatase [Nocardioidaceae bacterium]
MTPVKRPERRRVVLATRNPKKLAELRRIVEPQLPDITVLGLDDVAPYDEPAETEATFVANALIKASAAVAATALPALADDSGLCVDALNGMPGVLSARWSGRAKDDAANNALLLAQTVDVPDERRSAQFRCAMALVTPHDGERVRTGVMRGRLLREAVGDGGFGYDPLFVADGQLLSNGELSPAAKDAISHRGEALRAIVPDLVAVLAS